MPNSLLPAVPDPTALSGNELAKSRSTRRRILEAARDILAEQGYQRFSTGAVAARAGLTRPAMLYHFGSRRELLTAVIHHLARRRMEMLQKSVAEASFSGGFTTPQFRSVVAEISWKQLETPEFAAFSELAMAARTDPELAEVIRPALEAFDRGRSRLAEQSLPPELFASMDSQLASDVVRFLTEGAMQMGNIVDNREERLADLRHFVASLVATPEGHAFLASTLAGRKKEAGAEKQAAE
ncbi:TetR/AcrR family transcriptional regulator [Sandaracinobacteroides hominis]|uniref:TetR/AcrR family transcriptional regulator n=1 Tax=Sandaracinobacteroides hominis TaxID=2780086 RepID=UPI0018F315C6|nr:TetR/AcrR family transcriptional regulator [Sandaracinobacteroides hominis]